MNRLVRESVYRTSRFKIFVQVRVRDTILVRVQSGILINNRGLIQVCSMPSIGLHIYV